jgi:hypothetical protein
MNTFAKLKSGEIMVVWSDNSTEETMNLYPISCMPFDPEVHTTREYPYSAIAETDTNIVVLQSRGDVTFPATFPPKVS